MSLRTLTVEGTMKDKLNGAQFSDWVAVHNTFLAFFNEHRHLFPPGYAYLQLIEWAVGKDWICAVGETGFRIEMENSHENLGWCK